MGRVVEGGGLGAGKITSPQRVVIEKVQAELRQEYDVREERRRELDFLEKGGDPLEFKLSTTSSLSLQSTSVTDQQPKQFMLSEAKGSIALAASPHGDSVESRGRPVVRLLREPDCSDNLMLFNGENEFPDVERNLSKRIFTPSEQSSQLAAQGNSNELKSSASFNVPRNSYRRRSRPNRDGVKTGSKETSLARSSSLSLQNAPREVKGLPSDVEIQTDQTILVSPNLVPRLNKGPISKSPESPSEMNGVKASKSTGNAPSELIHNHVDQQMLLTAQKCPRIVPEDQECPNKKQDSGSVVLESQPCLKAAKLEPLATCGQTNGYGVSNDNMNDLRVSVQKNSGAVAKVLDSEASCTGMGSNPDGCNGNESTNQNSIANVKEHILMPQVTPVKHEASELEEQKRTQPLDSAVPNDENNLNDQNQENNWQNGSEKEVELNPLVSGSTVKDPLAVQCEQVDTATDYLETDNRVNGCGTAPIATNQELVKSSSVEHPEPKLPEPKLLIDNSAVRMEREETNAKAVSKADEDAVLKEAGVIEAKRKRIAELSAAAFPLGNHQKSHWDYVLEEMAWLANDFAQERLWKMTASAQLCHRVAYTSQFRFQEKHRIGEQKRVAHLLSEAVMQFWSSAEDSSKDMPLACRKDSALTLRQYAVNFLKFNSSCVQHKQAEAPPTPDRNSDSGTMDLSCYDNLTEENLFYMVPSGAMETYRESIESHAERYEKAGCSLQENVETSAFGAATAFGALQNAYEEEEGETCDISKSYRHAQKKRKILPIGYGRRPYEVGADSMYSQCMEDKLGSQQAVFMVKRPASSLNVSIPTKRVRTASRQRVLSPFTAGTSGYVPSPSKADASSGDTSPFHDDQSTPYGEAIMPNHLEAESERNFEKHLPFDSTGVSKPRKKKKQKHLGSAYEQRWQVDSNFQSEQRDHSKKRSERHQLEANGGLLGQHISKKPKVMRPSALDNSFDNIPTGAGSVPSPVASQIGNMSGPNIKIIGGVERGRKPKASKVPTRQQGSGSPWSQFEDQALIVLVHDMGPNWELVSDAINCTLQFKCIYRKPDDCKERHMALMDRTTGDGVDSAEDSGSSQPYPSTLPGIPKGSARQLFQQLQRPMEEETLKSHFEKIIAIMQKHCRKSQNGNHDPKQLQQPHSSHMLALSQACPNNLNGGPVLTPLDLCAKATPDPDIGFQSPHNNFLPASNQTSVPSMPAPQGPNFSSSPGSLNPYVRDGRYAIPRPPSLSIDEQRMQQYNQMLPARNIQQPGGNGMGVMGGVNRGGPVARPGFQTMAQSPKPQIVAPEFHGQTSQTNQGVPPYVGSNFANQAGVPPMPMPVLSRSLPVSSQQPQMLNHRPHFQGANQASNPQNQVHALRLMKERQLQQRIRQQQHQHHQQFVSSNAVSPHVQPPTQLHMSTSLPNTSQFRPQLSSSPPVPVSAALMPSSSSVPHHQQKHQMPPHGVVRNSQTGGSGLANHLGKQRRHPQQQQPPQQLQQAGRNHPDKRLQPLTEQHPKHVKGAGRGNLIQRSTSIDSGLPNGLSTTSGNHSRERSEQAMHSVQGQGLYAGSTKILVSPNSLSHCEPMYPGQVAPTSNNIEMVASHSVAPTVTASSNHQQPQLQGQQKAVNNNPPTPKRLIQASRQVNSDMPTKLQSRESPSEQSNISNNPDPARTAPLACKDVTEGIPVVSSSADQRNASEQLHESVTVTPSNFSAGTHLADEAGEATVPLRCKQSSPQPTSPVPQPHQPTSPVSQLHQQQLPQHSLQQGPVVQSGKDPYITPGGSRD